MVALIIVAVSFPFGVVSTSLSAAYRFVHLAFNRRAYPKPDRASNRQMIGQCRAVTRIPSLESRILTI
jgi:hypothetical protein